MGNDELHAEYEQELSRITDPSFSSIRDVAVSLLGRFSKAEMDELYDDLDRGKAIIDREELLWRYLLAFGKKHRRHLGIAMAKLPKLKGIVGQGYTVIDWGCGQGLATICFLDRLKALGIGSLPERVILVEPSQLALANAMLHVGLYGIESIEPVEKRLDDVKDDDIETDTPVTIHLFSNILDVDGFDLKRLASLVSDNARGENYMVCVCPRYLAADRRLTEFKNHFSDIEVYSAESVVQPTEGICTSYAVFRFTAGISSVIDVDYYPPVQFFASYQLDSIASASAKKRDSNPPLWSAFEVAAPFELGGYVYDDVHPILAVLNNIVTRGLPTRCSPFLEKAFACYGETPQPDSLGSISFSGTPSDDRTVRFIQAWSPVGVARVQKTVLEALICGRLSLGAKEWNILARERDVPCVALAFADLAQMLGHLAAMAADYQGITMPEIRLTVIGAEACAESPLHLGADVRTEADDELRTRRYDMVIDVSACSPIDPSLLEFSEYRAKNDCYFVVGSAERIRSTRSIYTSDAITYVPLGGTDRSGTFVEDVKVVGHLTYFLNLLFRKREFRPGQVPILNRALQNKNVIGLLPTGGGKSLTYQLAAMLQPGVTIVVDPLRSLMQDQYEGLLGAGIDACTYINSTVSPTEKRNRERRMESSELQFVFLSPERLCIYEFRERLQTMHEMGVYFSYGVIDEVHCVSEWGHDFRFSYLHLGRNMYQYVHAKNPDKRLVLFGLTATASFDVLADVERELSGAGAYPLDANTIVRYENTDRLELQYRIERVPVDFPDSFKPYLGPRLPKARYVSKWQANDEKSEYLTAHIRDIPGEIEELQTAESLARIRARFAERQNVPLSEVDEPMTSELPANMFERRTAYEQGGIVFCPHRESTGVSVEKNREALTGIVPGIGTFVGSSDDDKQQDEESFRNLSRFKNDEQLLMIATKAFGMGIDKPNVRFTVNMNYPSSLESFVQEAGRAGRDRRVSLATILVGDYKLSRVSPSCPIETYPIPQIRGQWYNEDDLLAILAQFGIRMLGPFIETATPTDDWVIAECGDLTGFKGRNKQEQREERKRRRKVFEDDRCRHDCVNYGGCNLRKLPSEARGWHRLSEIEGTLERHRIPRLSLRHLNTDYGNNMYFYNNSFVGERDEKKALYELFCQTPMEVSLDCEAERGLTRTVDNVIDEVLSLAPGAKLVCFVKYAKQEGVEAAGYNGTQKAIYRMCCVGFVEDFTQDFARNEFRLVMVRKCDGGYYDGLRQFLMRYYADARAEEIVAHVPSRRGENEVQKCLGFLTEFTYSKIAVKRKRALDDVRIFCEMGLRSGKDWKETNEELKDHIYYYFNSKYAQDNYVADNGEDFSLTDDTERGRTFSDEVALKYLRVVTDELVGAGGTPIDNVKHLQGAVRLIRRSLTDANPALELLNFFCLTQLGTNDSEALEQELHGDYRSGMEGFADWFESKAEFWRFKEDFDHTVSASPNRYDSTNLQSLQDEMTARLHLASLQDIRHSYAGYKRKQVNNEQ